MKELDDILEDAACEVYNGSLDFGHVPTEDFMAWLEHTKSMDGMPAVERLDIQSAMRLFEEQVLKSIATSA